MSFKFTVLPDERFIQILDAGSHPGPRPQRKALRDHFTQP